MNNDPGNCNDQVHVVADIPLHAAKHAQAEEQACSFTHTFAEHLLEKFTQLSDALEIFFHNSPISSHPFGETMVSQLRFCIRQSCNLVKSQERLLEELEATQKALNQKDEALERMTQLYVKGQAARSRIRRASIVQDVNSKVRPGRREERPTQEQGGSNPAVPGWI
ncbi:hypothetical protein HZ326_26966 [Fusarium oxysporum f. sp. albedinis]|nr:hypothetical protein HZ326_26966 [Fusarium oxysporum f. sp. albedinis]